MMTGKEGKRRQSSFELLRIISMVLVVVTHVDFYSLGWPVPGDMVSEPTRTIAKLFFESLAICCADVFVLLCILNTLICILLLKNGRGVQKYFYYTSPFVILSSISLLLAFSKLEFYSSGVNYMASSAFAVYLFHQNHFIVPGFKNTVIHLFNNNDALLFFCKISLFVLAIFVIAVLLDQVRKGFEYLFRKGYYALRGTNGKL